jgi:GNAT superfamily N-acetyltransferase
MTVRLGTQADIAAAEDVWRLSVTERDGTPPSPDVAATVGQILRADDAQLFLAEEDGEVIGMACTLPGRQDGDPRGPLVPGLCHVQMVFVRPSRWGGGIGGQLLDAVLEHARSIGQMRALLWVVEDNERATQLYARRGFTHTGRVVEEYGVGIGLWARDL